MSVYWIIAATLFAVGWVAMVRLVCIDANGGAGALALAFIPLFTIGVVIAAIAWPLALLALLIGLACHA